MLCDGLARALVLAHRSFKSFNNRWFDLLLETDDAKARSRSGADHFFTEHDGFFNQRKPRDVGWSRLHDEYAPAKDTPKTLRVRSRRSDI